MTTSMLNELRTILAEEKKIDPAIADRLTLAALVSVMDTLEQHKNEREQKFEEMHKDLEKINKNPMIVFGIFIAKHPKVTWTIAVLISAVVLIPHVNELWHMIAVLVNLYAGFEVFRGG